MTSIAVQMRIEFREQRQQFTQALRPALRKIDVLGVRDLERCVERGKPQRYDELVVADFLRNLGRDSNFVAHPLLLDAVRRRHQQNLFRLHTNGIFEDALPIIAAAQPQHVREHLVPKCRQLRAKPKCKGVVLWTGMADEKPSRAVLSIV